MVTASCLTGCSSLFKAARVSVETDPPLPKRTIKQIESLVSVHEVVDEGQEMIRLTATADEQHITAYLRSLGYYDPRIRVELDSPGDRPRVMYRINPGPLYRMESFSIGWPDNYPGPRPLITNEPVTAAAAGVLAARNSAIRPLREMGYPDARITNQSVIVDHQTTSMRTVLEIDPGPPVRFGKVEVNGLRKLQPAYIDKATPWKAGDPYDIRQVELLEQRLAASGLFSSIQSRRDPPANPADETYNLKLNIRERKARVLQLGVGYRTDTGAEASAQWQHRNTFGEGENLILRAKVNEDGVESELRLVVPFFLRADQQWGNSLKYTEEDTDAYESSSFEAESWIARDVSRRLTLRAGLALRYLDETEDDTSELYYLASIPGAAIWDYSNNRLDATEGHRIIFQSEPFQSIDNADQHFWKNLLTVNGYQPFNSEHTWMAALRVTAGSISGASMNSVPADIRFYAGGGQSVRGYEYQSLSPREGDNITGGLSLMETSLEIRGRLGRTLGVVLFIDGGSAFDEKVPDFSESFRWGTGAGFRYFSPVGPLRFDAGVPLDRRDGIDESWQFYISIGQAF